MKKTSDGKAPSPTRGNSKAVYELVSELGDWVSAEMIVGLVDASLFKTQANTNLSLAGKVENALLFLVYSGRFLKRKDTYQIAEFAYFDYRQKQLAAEKSSNALKAYLSEEEKLARIKNENPAPIIADPDQMILLDNFSPSSECMSKDTAGDLDSGIELAPAGFRFVEPDGVGGIDTKSVLFGFICGTFIGCLVSLIVVIGA